MIAHKSFFQPNKLSIAGLGAILFGCGEHTEKPTSGGVQWETVSTFMVHMCGILKSDQSLLCKGHPDTPSGQLDPPEGSYMALQTSNKHSCAISEEEEIECWGSDDFGVISQVPTGAIFTRISVGTNNACALDQDGQAQCWGSLPEGSLPAGIYVDLVNTMTNICGTLESGSTICLRSGDEPEVSLYGMHSYIDNFCGLSESRGGWCLKEVPAEIATGTWTAISPGSGYDGCALTEEGAVTCWGNEPLAVPSELADGRYSSIHNSDVFTCALRAEDSVLVCWGGNAMNGDLVSTDPDIWEM